MSKLNRNQAVGAVATILLLLGLGAALLSAPQPQGSGEQLVKGPIVQNVQKDRATIAWVTQRGTLALKKSTAEGLIPLDVPVYHHVDLENLEPATRYDYRFSPFGDNVKGSFQTAPVDKATPFMFVVFGDTRTRHEVHTKSSAKVLAEGPAFLLHTGDLVSDGRDAAQWLTFFDIEKELLRNTPFYPVLGNHESNAAIYFKQFIVPGGNAHHYSFDWGNLHVVALNTNEVGATGDEKNAFTQEQLAWLKADLESNKSSLRMVFFHHPLYTAVERRRESAAKLAAIYEPVLEQAGVHMVFSGHDHNYQHHLSRGIHYVVTGGGGAPLYDVVPIPGVSIKVAKVENYVRVRVNGSKAHLDAFDLEGNLLEAFDIVGR